MQEQLKYRNHIGEEINFGLDGIYVSSNELHDYNWSTIQKNNRISGLQRGIVNRSLPVVIFCKSVEDGLAARNRLMEVAEKDVLANKPGRIIIGDYYYKCYITGSKKSEYLKTRRMMQTALTVTTDKPYWIKETVHMFRKAVQGGGSTYDYPFDYSFDLLSSLQRESMANTDFIASNFRMVIYGPCSKPVVYISGHGYGVNCEAAEGEYITIDSVDKTVTRTAVDGTVTNLFNQRNRDSYIFQKIAAGTNTVTWDGDYGVDIILLEERSEPKWT